MIRISIGPVACAAIADARDPTTLVVGPVKRTLVSPSGAIRS